MKNNSNDNLIGKHCGHCGYTRQASDAKKLKSSCPVCQHSYSAMQEIITGNNGVQLVSNETRTRAKSLTRQYPTATAAASYAPAGMARVTFGKLLHWGMFSMLLVIVGIVTKLY